jgi:hypothetical protein
VPFGVPNLGRGAAVSGLPGLCLAKEIKNQETEMSKSIKAFVAVGLIALVAACGQQEEETVMVEPEPIVMEPVSDKM